MTLIQNILVGVDLHQGDRLASVNLGEESQAAVAEALDLAATWGASVTFCSVLEISAQSQSLIEHDRDSILTTVEDLGKAAMIQLAVQAAARGIVSEAIVRFGKAWEELSTESGTGKYDLMVVGSRTKQSMKSLLFGSTAQKLMRFSSCPVWVVKPSEIREIRDVAIATDLSPATLPVFKTAVTVARAIGARLHVLHALEFADLLYLVLAGVDENELAKTESRLRREADEKLREHLHLTDFRTLPHGVQIEYLDGSPDTVIPEYVSAHEIDLLVIGSHGHSGIGEMLLGSTAERFLPGIHASLLVVKTAGFRSPYGKLA